MVHIVYEVLHCLLLLFILGLPDLQHDRQQVSPEKFHNLLSLASSPPLSSHVSTQLSPTAQEFVPGKSSHDPLPAAAVAISQQSSTPSFAQVYRVQCT